MAAVRNGSNFSEEIIVLSSSDEEESKPDSQSNLDKDFTSCAQKLNQDDISTNDDTLPKISSSRSLKEEDKILYSRITWENVPDSSGSQPNDRDKSLKENIACCKIMSSSSISRDHLMGNSSDNVKSESEGAVLSDKCFKNGITDNDITHSTKMPSFGSTDNHPVNIMVESEQAMSSFLTVCRAFVDDDDGLKIIQSANKHYSYADTDFVHTKQFCDFMNKKSKNVLKDSQNVFLHMKDVIDELKAYRYKKRRFLGKVVVRNTSPVHDLVCNGTSDTSVSENCTNNISANGTAASHRLTGLECVPSSSTSSKKQPTEKQIKRLESLLQKIDKKIKRLQKKELSLDSLDDNDSAYVQEDIFKKRFIKVWNKLCSLTGRSNETGRETEKKFRFNGSRYPEINVKISKFVNKKKIFPDYSDVLSVVSSVNTTLKLPDMQVHMLAREIFEEVGKVLQMRRYKENRELFGCFLTDGIDFSQDPAEYNAELKSALQESYKKASNDLDEIIDKYVQKQVELKLEPDDVQDNEKSEHSSEEQDENDNESERSDVDFIEATVVSDDENVIDTAKEDEVEHNVIDTAKEDEVEHNKDENGIDTTTENNETEHNRAYYSMDEKSPLPSTSLGILGNCAEENSTSSSDSSLLRTLPQFNLPSTSNSVPSLPSNSILSKRHQECDITPTQAKIPCLENKNNYLDNFRNFLKANPTQPQIDDDVIIVE